MSIIIARQRLNNMLEDFSHFLIFTAGRGLTFLFVNVTRWHLLSLLLGEIIRKILGAGPIKSTIKLNEIFFFGAPLEMEPKGVLILDINFLF